MSLRVFAAVLVHLLTTSGVICTLFAFISITDQALDVAFYWLALALFIDTIDGPLARLVDTKTHLPRFCGERLDLIIDYLNYVALPAFIVVKIPMIDGSLGHVAAVLILMTSLFHFSDMSSKTTDGYFVGFPAVWNVVVFYLLVFQVTQLSAFAVVLVLSVMTFVPVKWVHPFRVVSMREITVAVIMALSYASLMIIQAEFRGDVFEKILLIGGLVYLVSLSLRRSLMKAVG